MSTSTIVMGAKLISGEEIVYCCPKHDHTSAEKPRVLNIIMTERGAAVHMTPFLIGSPESTVRLSLDRIIASYEAPRELENAYLQNTSRLTMASSLPQAMNS